MTVEPDMENLLASIRQAIDDDLGDHGPYATLPPGTERGAGAAEASYNRLATELPSPRSHNVAAEINELRNKIQKQRNGQGTARTPFAQIMAGEMKPSYKPSALPALPVAPDPRRSFASQPSPLMSYASASHQVSPSASYGAENEEDWQEEDYAAADEQVYTEEPQNQLMSQDAAQATHSSFNDLAEALVSRALNERPIEDVAQELLRGMLRNWLDVNLPPLVERLVREEISRVARRGR